MTSTTPMTRLRRWLAATIAAVAAIALTACGALIETQLTIAADGSGSRDFTATLTAAELEDVPGGSAAIDAAIVANIPAELAYVGMSAGPEGEAIFSFSVGFSSPEEYEQKVIAILGAGEIYDETQAEIIVAATTFRQGVSVEENFDSADLLQWLVNALVRSGTLPSSEAGNATEMGDTVVQSGEDTAVTSDRISYSTVDDRGVRELIVTTTGAGTGAYERTITFDLPREIYAQDQEGFDAYFEAATPDGGVLTEPAAAETVWTIAFEAASEADLIAGTDQALSSESTDFALSSSVDPDDPTRIVTSVVDVVDCSHVCADDASVQLDFDVPAGWTQQSGSHGSTEPVVYSHPVTFLGITVDVEFDADGAGSATYVYEVGGGDAELVGDALEAALSPTDGEVEIEQRDGAVAYTATLQGDDLSAVLSSYAPESTANAQPLADSPFSSTRLHRFVLALPESVGPSQAATYRVAFSGGSVQEGALVPDGTTIDGSTLEMTSSTGIVDVAVEVEYAKPVAVVVAIVIGLLVLAAAAIVVVVVVRRRAGVPAAPESGRVPPPVIP